MINYLGEKYTDINDLARHLKCRPAMANHLFHCNGGTKDDVKDLRVNNSLFVEGNPMNPLKSARKGNKPAPQKLDT